MRLDTGYGPTFKDILTPGFSTSHPDTWASRKGKSIETSAEERQKMEKALARVIAKERDEERRKAHEAQEERLKVMTLDSLGNVTGEAKKPKDMDKKMVAVDMSTYFAEHPQSFMAVAPMSVTVMNRGRYSKRPLIGGEAFNLVSCYVGKRGAIIYQLAPQQPCDFNLIEVTEKEASDLFNSSFSAYLEQAGAVDFRRAEKLEKALSADQKEQKEADRKRELYGDLGFGSW